MTRQQKKAAKFRVKAYLKWERAFIAEHGREPDIGDVLKKVYTSYRPMMWLSTPLLVPFTRGLDRSPARAARRAHLQPAGWRERRIERLEQRRERMKRFWGERVYFQRGTP